MENIKVKPTMPFMAPQVSARAHRRLLRRGQALVESLLVLPLVVFLLLGTLQLFMIFQAKIMAQYAAMRAVRAGALNRGSCDAMMRAAIASVLPTTADTSNAQKYKKALEQYGANLNLGTKVPLVEIYRESPTLAAVAMGIPYNAMFDTPLPPKGAQAPDPMTLKAGLLYWYRLRIPFADYVITRMFMAYWGLQAFTGVDPTMPIKTQSWPPGSPAPSNQEVWPTGAIAATMLSFPNGQFFFPIQVRAAMRMMVPADSRYFDAPACPLVPPYWSGAPLR
jgi:hypothetical protein